MKEFIQVFENILTQLNDGIYYNPLQHTEKQNEEFCKRVRNNNIEPIENGKAKFEGLEFFNKMKVLVFSYETFRFKMPIDIFIMSFSKNIKALDIKKSEIKKESEFNESEIKAISRLKKVTEKKANNLYQQCVFFMNDIKKAFASNGSIFVYTDINNEKSGYDAFNIVSKEIEENKPLKENSIKSVTSFTSKLKITFDVKVLICVLKSMLLKGDYIVRLSESENLYFNIDNLLKALSFIPKKQKTIDLLIKDSKSCAHIFNVLGEHIGIMPAFPKDCDCIESVLGIEDNYIFSIDYNVLSNDNLNK